MVSNPISSSPIQGPGSGPIQPTPAQGPTPAQQNVTTTGLGALAGSMPPSGSPSLLRAPSIKRKSKSVKFVKRNTQKSAASRPKSDPVKGELTKKEIRKAKSQIDSHIEAEKAQEQYELEKTIPISPERQAEIGKKIVPLSDRTKERLEEIQKAPGQILGPGEHHRGSQLEPVALGELTPPRQASVENVSRAEMQAYLEAFKGKSDMRTPHDQAAIKHSSIFAAGMFAMAAKTDGIIPYSKILKGVDPKAQLINTLNAFKELADIAKLSDAKLLKEVRGLLTKSLSVTNGGVGSFIDSDPPKWKNEWDSLFKLQEKVENGKKGEVWVGTEDAFKRELGQFKEMCQFFIDEAPHQVPSLKQDGEYDDSRLGVSQAKADQTLRQLSAFKGQILNDLVMISIEDFGGDNSKLAPLLNKHRVTNKPFGTDAAKEIEVAQGKIRSSPLIGEVKKKDLLSAIGKSVQAPLKKQVEAAIAKLKITGVDSQALVGKITSKLDYTAIAPENVPWGLRGRGTKGKQQDYAKLLRGLDREDHPTGMPSNIQDKALREDIIKVLKDQPGFDENLIKDTVLEESLKHAPGPTTVLRYGSPIEEGLIDLVQNPEEHIQEIISDLLKTDLSVKEKRILRELETKNPGQNVEIRRAVNSAEIQYSKDSSLKMPLEKYIAQKTIAGIMFENNLRLLCSISGTTTDIFLSFVMDMGTDEVKKLLAPLSRHLHNLLDAAPLDHDLTKKEKAAVAGVKYSPPQGADKDTQEAYDSLKTLLTGLSFYMQTGQYHTASEVLGGAAIVAIALDDTIPNDQAIKAFERLAINFSKNPKDYLPLSDAQKEQLLNSKVGTSDKTISERAVEKHNELAKARAEEFGFSTSEGIFNEEAHQRIDTILEKHLKPGSLG